jgi:hypothetical protein
LLTLLKTLVGFRFRVAFMCSVGVKHTEKELGRIEQKKVEVW